VFNDPKAEATSGRAESGVHVVRTGHGTHRLELWGAMPVGWLGNFTRGATRLSFDIVRGQAKRGAHRRWSASFEMRSPADAAVVRVDFLALAREAGESVAPVPLELRTFQLSRSSDREGTLELRIAARDHVGFLASLLQHLAGFVLFPEEISIDTFQDEARDTVFLSSVGGQSPPPEIEDALRASLRESVSLRRSLFPGA
jgi:hypothetical protein